MQILKYSLYSLFLMSIVLSCAKEPLPFETYDEMAKGAFSRMTSTDGGAFFYPDPDNSSFSFELEYYSENNGAEVAKNEWYVYHRNNVTGEISEPALMASVESSAFGKNAKSGLPSASFTFTMNDALAAMGKTIDDVNALDDFIFDGFVVMKDGRRFGPDNTDGSIQGGAGFDGKFRFIKTLLLCPSDLAGEYSAHSVGTSTDDCCPDETTVDYDVTLTETGVGEYTISDWSGRLYFIWYEIYGITSDFDMTGTIMDVCGEISGTFGEPFGTDVTISGSVDQETGVITYTWTNGYDDTATVVLTPK